MRDHLAPKLFPKIQLLGYDEAVRLALGKLGAHGVETAWTDALTSSQGIKTPVSLISTEGMIIERRQQTVAAPADAVYRSFSRLGGERGWLYLDWTWQLRGMVDRLCGGVGMRRGRRDPNDLRDGDIATAAISVNAIPKVMSARPGVLTMRDIPLVHSYNKEEARNPPKK